MYPVNAHLVGPATTTVGAASLAQGVYGARGNLELVACDRDEGLWVYWFNADSVADPPATPDVPPGTWSAGLHFAAGAAYLQAEILQSTLGPDHLEVLALDADGVLQSWFWSPGPGFVRRRTDAAQGATAFHAAHSEGELRVTVQGGDGSRRHLVSGVDGYPERSWSTAAVGPGTSRDATDEIVRAGVDPADIVADSARSVRSRRGGGTTELTWRDADGGIRHLGVPDA